MTRYMQQGSKTMDVGVVAPMSDRGGEAIIREAEKATTGIVTSQRGLGKNGVPIKGKG